MIGRRRTVARLGPALPLGAPVTGRRSLLAAIGRVVPLGARRREAVRQDLGSAADEVVGRKAVFAAGGALAALVLARPPASVAALPLFAIAGWRAPDVLGARRAKERDAEILAGLPDAVDLMVACAVAGMGIDRALRVVAAELSGPFGEALRAMLGAIDVGVPRREAYRLLMERAPIAEVRNLVRALERAERYGTPFAPALVAQAREVRARRRAAVEETARAAEVRMLFPLVTCFLPAFVLLTVAPIVITALRSFRTP